MNKYSPEFREEAVKQVVESQRPINQVAREREISSETLRNRVRKHKQEIPEGSPSLALDDEVDAQPGRRAGLPGPPGGPRHRRGPAQDRAIQPAGHLPHHRGRPPRRPRCPPFRYISDQVTEQLDADQPVFSADTKTKEVLGDYAVTGLEWHRAGRPTRGRAHDFPEKSAQKAARMASTTSEPTSVGYQWAGLATPPHSPWPPCAAGGRSKAATATRT